MFLFSFFLFPFTTMYIYPCLDLGEFSIFLFGEPKKDHLNRKSLVCCFYIKHSLSGCVSIIKKCEKHVKW